MFQNRTGNLKKKTSNHDSEEGKFQTIIFKNVFKGNTSFLSNQTKEKSIFHVHLLNISKVNFKIITS